MKKFPILFCIVLVTGMVLAGCGNPTSYSVLGISGGSTWPPDTVLTDYGIAGLPKPSDAFSLQYTDSWGLTLTITFNVNTTTMTEVESYFSIARGWKSPDLTVTNKYTNKKITPSVTYSVTLTNNSNSFELVVSKDAITGSGTL